MLVTGNQEDQEFKAGQVTEQAQVQHGKHTTLFQSNNNKKARGGYQHTSLHFDIHQHYFNFQCLLTVFSNITDTRELYTS